MHEKVIDFCNQSWSLSKTAAEPWEVSKITGIVQMSTSAFVLSFVINLHSYIYIHGDPLRQLRLGARCSTQGTDVPGEAGSGFE